MAGIENPILLDLPVPIHTKRLILRPLAPGDGAALFEAASESMAELAPWDIMDCVKPATTPEDCEIIARKCAACFLQRHFLLFGMWAGERFVGIADLGVSNWKIPSGKFGYWLRTSETGRGYMTEAISAICLYAFREIGMRRLEIRCDETNAKSAAVAERLGFVLESTAPMADVHPQTGKPTTELTFVRFNADGLADTDISWGQTPLNRPLTSC